jgi:dTMP kinase
MDGSRIPGGLLIAFEGIDGSGKSTQARRLERSLRERGFDVVGTKEPTHGPWGEKLRRSFRDGRLPRDEEIEAFIADRQEHVAQVIAPSMRRGAVVICDRYFLSNAAYQGTDLPSADAILRRNEAIAKIPDRVFVIEVPPDAGLRRVERRGAPNTFEGLEALRSAATIVRAVDRPYIERIDGTRPQKDVSAQILRSAEALIDARRGPAR